MLTTTWHFFKKIYTFKYWKINLPNALKQDKLYLFRCCRSGGHRHGVGDHQQGARHGHTQELHLYEELQHSGDTGADDAETRGAAHFAQVPVWQPLRLLRPSVIRYKIYAGEGIGTFPRILKWWIWGMNSLVTGLFWAEDILFWVFLRWFFWIVLFSHLSFAWLEIKSLHVEMKSLLGLYNNKRRNICIFSQKWLGMVR